MERVHGLTGFWDDRSLRSKLLLAVSIPVLALLAVIGTYLVVQENEGASRRQVDRTLAFASDIAQTLRLLVDAETGVRGFLLMGQDPWLDPYREALAALPPTLERLDALLEDQQAEAEGLLHLRGLIDRCLEILAALAQVAPGPAEPLSAAGLSLLVEGKAVMDEIRTSITELQAVEARLVAERKGIAEDARSTGAMAIMALLVLGLIGGVSTTVLLAVGVSRRIARLQQAAVRVGAGEPLGSLPGGRDEIGQLAVSLREASALLSERQRALDTAVAELQDLYQNAPVGYHSLDAQGRIVQVNDTELRWLGFAREELIGRPIVDLLTDAGRARFAEAFPRLLRDGSVRDVEIELVQKAGGLLPVAISATAMRDVTGALVRTRTIVEDATQRRIAERAVRERVRLLDLVHDAIVTTDADGRVLSWNEGATRTYGFSAEQAIGERIDSLLRTSSPVGRDTLMDTLRVGDSWDGDLGRKHRDGRDLVVASRMVLDHDPELDTDLVIEIDRDVTETRAADRRLREYVNGNPDALGLLDAIVDDTGHLVDLRIAHINDEYVAFLGSTREQLLGHTWLQRFPEQRETEFARYVQVMESGRPLDMTGLTREIPGKGARVFDGRIIRIDHALAIQLRDVTDLRLAEDELGAFFRQSGDLLTVVDLDGRFIRVNAAWERALGRPAGDLVGRRFLEFVHPDDREATIAEFARERRDGLAASGFLNRYRFADGTDHWLEWSAQPSPESGRVFAVARDVTERYHHELELRAAREEAERADRAKTEFLSRMSHELRTPLNAILGFAQLLARDDLAGPQRESVEQILRGGRHLLDLINEVLDISRLTTGQLPLSPEPVDINGIVADVLTLLGPVAADRSVVLRSEVPDAGWHVLADIQRLKQVLLNLVVNAIRYGPADSEVRVVASDAGPAIRITVVDSGPGIPGHLVARLFQPFERLQQADRTEGTGLGLALSRALVTAMGGTMGVESAPDLGSRFWLELPRAEPREEDLDGQRQTIGTGIQPGTGSVLCIEDNPSNMRLLERVMEARPGVRLLPAMLGSLGLELASQHRPSLVLLDLHLPDMDGLEVLSQLKADPVTRPIPVVILSADVTPGRAERLRAAGAHAFLGKPLDIEAFLSLLDTILGA